MKSSCGDYEKNMIEWIFSLLSDMTMLTNWWGRNLTKRRWMRLWREWLQKLRWTVKDGRTKTKKDISGRREVGWKRRCISQLRRALMAEWRECPEAGHFKKWFNGTWVIISLKISQLKSDKLFLELIRISRVRTPPMTVPMMNVMGCHTWRFTTRKRINAQELTLAHHIPRFFYS